MKYIFVYSWSQSYKNNYSNAEILELAQLQKSQFQSYKAVFMTKIMPKDIFGVNCGVKSYAQICA
jgi:hypothetical protein